MDVRGVDLDLICYAYWKNDNGNLHKKYIGKYPPQIEKTNKQKSNRNDALLENFYKLQQVT